MNPLPTRCVLSLSLSLSFLSLSFPSLLYKLQKQNQIKNEQYEVVMGRQNIVTIIKDGGGTVTGDANLVLDGRETNDPDGFTNSFL